MDEILILYHITKILKVSRPTGSLMILYCWFQIFKSILCKIFNVNLIRKFIYPFYVLQGVKKGCTSFDRIGIL